MTVAVIGAGPAGLMAAEVISAAGVAVTVYDRMPSAGRKLLMAGRGGLNLTHSEAFDDFLHRYGDAAPWLKPVLAAFPPAALIAWAESLGQPTFVGSSGRIFPKALKASPLLRAWLLRLRQQGVTLRLRHDWLGWARDGALRFTAEAGEVTVPAAATVLALGGASWPRLGSTGAWSSVLAGQGVAVTPFRPANAGFTISWTPAFARFAGTPLKSIALSFGGQTIRGEAMVAGYGLEGGAVYALSAPLREAIARSGLAILTVDLKPDMTLDQIAARLARPRKSESLSNFLRKALGLAPVQINLLREGHGMMLAGDAAALALQVKAVPLRLTGMQGLDRAISSAGGVAWDEVDARLMLRAKPGVFAAGEMLDWEAPTGGYLLQATLATGVAAGKGVLQFLEQHPKPGRKNEQFSLL